MLRHYVTIAVRQLRREKGYAVLNAVGLALGLACAMLAALYVRDELSFDAFHEDGERLLAVVKADSTGVPAEIPTPYPLANALAALPEVEGALRMDWGMPQRMRRPGGEEVSLVMLQTDTTFFSFFSFPLQRGVPEQVLGSPDALVLTEESARTLFGDADPVGETVEFYRAWPGEPAWMPLRVTGVTEAPPTTSTIRFDAVARLSLRGPDQTNAGVQGWYMSAFRTFARLRSGTDAERFAETMSDRIAAVDPDNENGEIQRRFASLPFADYYFSGLIGGSRFTGERQYVRLFVAIALVVLLIAGLNYVNLSTVRSLKRAREVGVRKAVGAERGQVARQMLTEAVLLATGAFVLALGLVWAALPSFNSFFGKSAALHPLHDAGLLAGMLAGTLLVGVLAGLYPAFVLARYRPTQVLKAGSPGGPGGTWLRRGLVVTQFAATIGLLLFTGLVFGQLDHLKRSYPLPDDARLVSLDVPNEWQKRTPTVKAALRDLPGVTGVAATTSVPGRMCCSTGMDVEGQPFMAASVQADRDFINVMGLPQVHTSPEQVDLPFRLYLNEAALQSLGWTWEPGMTFPVQLMDRGSGGEGETPVAGILRDFPYNSLREPIGPLYIAEAADTMTYNRIVARVSDGQIAAFQTALPGVWTQFSVRAPQVEYVDDFVAELYRGETQFGQIVTFFALLALLVACLGLFGLAAYAAAQRTKEIGVRKVLGAQPSGLVTLLTRDFVVLVLVACVFAMPLAYLVARRWLEGFVERAPIGAGVFVAVAVGALLVAIVTVGGQAYRAARANPIEALRYE